MSTAPKIACLGDSLTWGFPYGPKYSWVYLVGQRTGLNLINMGINGNTTEDMLHRFIPQVVKANPTHVIIMGGTNDIICRESIPRITCNLKNIVDAAKHHNIQPILGLPIPLGWKEAESRLARVRDWIVNYVIESNLHLIDFSRGFYWQQDDGELQIRWDLMLDGSHPTIEGYEVMADQFDAKALGLLTQE